MQRTLARNLREGTLETAQKAGRGPGPRAVRTSWVPLEFLEGNAARTAEADALQEEQAPLLLEPPAPSEGDAAAAVDNAVPGKPVFAGRCAKNPDDLAGGPMVSGECSDLGVGGDFSTRDRLDHALDSFFEFHCLSLI